MLINKRLIFVFILVSFSSFAENIKTVVVTSIGDSIEDARSRAVKRALDEVIEGYLTHEVHIQNEKKINNTILELNKGYFKKIKVLETRINNELGGAWEMKAEVDVIVDKLVQKLEDENITTITDPAFIAKVIGVFDNTDKFRKIYKKDILRPIFNNGLPNGSAYNIKFQGMEPYIDDSSSGLKEQKSIYHFASKEDEEKYGKLEILPFYFNFKVSLKDEFIYDAKKFYKYMANGNMTERVCTPEEGKSTNCCKDSSVCIIELKNSPKNENWFIGATATEYDFSSIQNRIVNDELEKIREKYNINRHSGAYFNLEFTDKDKNIIGSLILGGEGAKPVKGSKYSSTSIITRYKGWGKPWHKNIAPMISGFYINKKALIDNNQTFVAIVLLSKEEAERIKNANFTITWSKPADGTNKVKIQ